MKLNNNGDVPMVLFACNFVTADQKIMVSIQTPSQSDRIFHWIRRSWFQFKHHHSQMGIFKFWGQMEPVWKQAGMQESSSLLWANDSKIQADPDLM